MATKTFEELKQLAIQIRDEKTNKQNTATRIGTQMLEHLDKLEQDYYDKTATDEELKERDEKLTELEGNIENIDKSGVKQKTATANDHIADFTDEQGNILFYIDINGFFRANIEGFISIDGLKKMCPFITDTNSGNMLDFVDRNGNKIMSLNKFGEFEARGMTLSRASNNGHIFDFVDDNGNLLFYIDKNGKLIANYPNIENDGNHWLGKKWYAFGTSLTDTSTMGKYAPYLAELSGMIHVNKGIGGAGITTASNQLLYQSIMAFNEQDADLITLECCANDGNAPLGEVYDLTDNSTMCGALNLCIRHLQKNTNAQIVVISSTIGRYSPSAPDVKYDGTEKYGSDEHTALEQREAVRKVCQFNGVPYIPWGESGGFGISRIVDNNKYLIDQIHHTDLGGYNSALFIWSNLKNIPLWENSLTF